MSAIVLAAIMAAGAGIAFGAVYFDALARTTTLLVRGGPLLLPLALTLARFMAAVAFLGLAAHVGAAALAAALGGFLVARAAALRRVRSRR